MCEYMCLIHNKLGMHLQITTNQSDSTGNKQPPKTQYNLIQHLHNILTAPLTFAVSNWCRFCFRNTAAARARRRNTCPCLMFSLQ